jgi:hypothetical protein
MGAWGYKAFQNDTACDFMFDIEAPIKNLFKKKSISQHQYDKFRAAGEIVIKLSEVYSFDEEEIIDKLIEKIQIIVNDADWISTWDDPDLMTKDLKRQIKQLTKLKNA